MGRPPKQTSLFWRETRQRSLGHEISPNPEVGRGRERGSWRRDPAEGSWRLESREAVGGWTQRGKQQRVGVDPRTGAVNTRHRSREARQHGIGSSEVSQDESDSSSIVEYSLVTHASDSPHMHIVLQYLPLLLVNPKFVRVCSFVLLFSPFLRSYSCVVARNVRCPLEPLVDHRPA